MKQLLFVCLLALLSSCTHIQTKFIFKEDGSGHFANALIFDEFPRENKTVSTKKDVPLKSSIQQIDERTKVIVYEAKNGNLVFGLSYKFDSMQQLLQNFKEMAEIEIDEKVKLNEVSEDEAIKLKESLSQLSSSASIAEYVEYSKIQFSPNRLSVSSYKLSEESRQEIKEFLELGSTDFIDLGPLTDRFAKMKYQFLYKVPGKIKNVQCSGKYRQIGDSSVLIEFNLYELGKLYNTPSLIIEW